MIAISTPKHYKLRSTYPPEQGSVIWRQRIFSKVAEELDYDHMLVLHKFWSGCGVKEVKSRIEFNVQYDPLDVHAVY